jgi:hypothetical protein
MNGTSRAQEIRKSLQLNMNYDQFVGFQSLNGVYEWIRSYDLTNKTRIVFCSRVHIWLSRFIY